MDVPNASHSYVPILTDHCNFVTDDASLDDILPIEDDLWNVDVSIEDGLEIRALG